MTVTKSFLRIVAALLVPNLVLADVICGARYVISKNEPFAYHVSRNTYHRFGAQALAPEAAESQFTGEPRVKVAKQLQGYPKGSGFTHIDLLKKRQKDMQE